MVVSRQLRDCDMLLLAVETMVSPSEDRRVEEAVGNDQEVVTGDVAVAVFVYVEGSRETEEKRLCKDGAIDLGEFSSCL
jgi:hypothetical protein